MCNLRFSVFEFDPIFVFGAEILCAESIRRGGELAVGLGAMSRRHRFQFFVFCFGKCIICI